MKRSSRLAFPSISEWAICKRCDEIEKTIQRYRWLERVVMDQITVDRTKELIANLQAKRAALHPQVMPAPPGESCLMLRLTR
jgi:hypothetical protein